MILQYTYINRQYIVLRAAKVVNNIMKRKIKYDKMEIILIQ